MAILSVERREAGVAVVTLDVPGEPVNTFSHAHSAELGAALDALAADPAVRAVVLRSGKSDSFIAGADINQFVAFTSAADAEASSRQAHAFVARVESFPKPIVVAIHGAASGSGSNCRWPAPGGWLPTIRKPSSGCRRFSSASFRVPGAAFGCRA